MYKGKTNRSDAPTRQKKSSDKFRSSKVEHSEKPRRERPAKTSGKPYAPEHGERKYPYKKRAAKPAPALKPESDEVRLNKFIANSGVCSRREADTYIQTGLVTVNGKMYDLTDPTTTPSGIPVDANGIPTALPTINYTEYQQRGNSAFNDWFGMARVSLTWKFNLPDGRGCNLSKF